MANLNERIQALEAVTYQQFAASVGRFVASQAAQFNAGAWFEGNVPYEYFLNADMAQYVLNESNATSNFFVPFVQKKIVDSASKVVVVADLHGDIDALIAILDELHAVGYLSADNRLIPGVQVVFLGDYINRCSSGVPVMMALFDLYHANPNNVVLLRGNHEYAGAARNYYQRHMPKDGTTPVQGMFPFLYELEQRFAGHTSSALFAWFDYLPMALYLGSADEHGVVTYTKLCHGGLEIGHNVADFLASPISEFKKITLLERKEALEQFKALDTISGLKEQVERTMALSVDAECAAYAATMTEQGFDVSSDARQSRVHPGMQWNNFVTEDNPEVEFALSPLRKNLYLGKLLTKHLFKRASGSKSCLASIMRGHQHLDEDVPELGLKTTMMTRIKHDKGVVKQWGGMVYTMGATSWVTGYQSFVVVGLSPSSTEISLKHFFKLPDQSDFSLKMIHFFNS